MLVFHHHFLNKTKLLFAANERQRTYSSLSFSSGSDYESRGHSCERMADFSEEEQLPDDISPQEGHFTKVPPTERKTNSKKGKTKLSLKLRKKKMIDKADRKSPSSDDDSVKRERSGSLIACSERQNDVVYSMDDLIQVCYKTDTIQYNAIQRNTIQYNATQWSTIQYNTIQYNTIKYNAMQYNAIQCNTIQYNKIQYNKIQ